MAASFEQLKDEGNKSFKEGQFELALLFYERALQLSPSSHVIHSNRSVAYYKLEKYDSALEEANKSVAAQEDFAKGYARKASALNALLRYSEAKEACVSGFVLKDEALCPFFVDEWLKASRAQVSPRFNTLKRPPWSDVLPEAADLFCDEYCSLLHLVVRRKENQAQAMTHQMMGRCVERAIALVETVLREFRQPLDLSFLRAWNEVAVVIDYESHPAPKRWQLMGDLKIRTAALAEWLGNEVHSSLRRVLEPILMIILSTLLVRGNELCETFTAPLSIEYLGVASMGFFDHDGLLSNPRYTAFNMAILSLVLNSYRLRGPLIEKDVRLIRDLCTKIDRLMTRLPEDHKNRHVIIIHYKQMVKSFRELCDRSLRELEAAIGPEEELSELEKAFLEYDSEPQRAMEVAVRYITEIANKAEATQAKSINFTDTENMLYITGIMAKLQQDEQTLRVLKSGEGMALSHLTNLLQNYALSLDTLPSATANCRKLALTGSMWIKDYYPVDSANMVLHWKGLFPEIRALMVRLGLGRCNREILRMIALVEEGGASVRSCLQMVCRAQEKSCMEKFTLPALRAVFGQDCESVAKALQVSDIVVDYTLSIHHPERLTPPQSLACALVLRAQEEPLIIPIADRPIVDMLAKWTAGGTGEGGVAETWLSGKGAKEFEEISNNLSRALFPTQLREILLDPKITRVFFCPDKDLVSFPIDHLPLKDEEGLTFPLYERVSVSILCSPLELVRDEAVSEVQSAKSPSPEEDAAVKTELSDTASASSAKLANVELSPPATFQCFVVADPDFKHECASNTTSTTSSWKQWLEKRGSLMGPVERPEALTVTNLKATQREADSVYQRLCTNPSFAVQRPMMQKEATLSALLRIRSPHVLHLATCGYAYPLSRKGEKRGVVRDFWSDDSSGILLAGAQTFLDGKWERLDVKACTGHLNAVAACGLQVRQTRLVFVSVSSYGRPSSSSSSSSSRGPGITLLPHSFTQALRAAGAQTVISTLWPVEEGEAEGFVSCFYDRLVAYPECRPSEALSYVKAAMKRRGKSPRHWAAYSCYGLDYPISTKYQTQQ